MILLLLVAAGACVTTTTVPATEYRRMEPINVAVRGSRAEAFRRTYEAMTSAGLAIEDADEAAGRIKSAPVPGDVVVSSGMAVVTVEPFVIYYAQILSGDSADAQRVVLTLTTRARMRSTSGTEWTPEMPAPACESACRGDYARIRSVAALIAREP